MTMTMLKDVVIVSACRTPIGSFGGTLKDRQAYHLASIVMKEALNRASLDPSLLSDVRFGCCLEPWDALNVARVAALLAGIPDSVPAVTMNRVCTSAMEAIVSGMFQIQAGFSEIDLVGGVEAMSNVPYVLPDARWGARYMDKTMVDALSGGLHAGSHVIKYPMDGPEEWARGKPYIMGLTAEFLARKHGITREDQDEVALRSHNNAERATEEGRFEDEIVPVTIPQRKGDPIIMTKDEHFRKGLTMEQLAKLPPAFIFDGTGTVTAGNSSGINDAAAAMVIMSIEKADELGLKPLAKISGVGMGGCAPEYMGESPEPAVKDLLKRTGHEISDYDLIEVNEAFASQYIACERLLGLNREITNVNGSGIGLGHPVGCTGTRLVVTLIHEMAKRGLKRGMATLCGGGGVSIATEYELM
ncbi:MAG TPA: acetyl-CoA C-acyltransferase [Candidatus Lokiarchaeia archaeon]|nr:acetyl-CoA C-acyltransferase [Candidatus Lokiarchaeia archaeon]